MFKANKTMWNYVWCFITDDVDFIYMNESFKKLKSNLYLIETCNYGEPHVTDQP